MYACLFLIRIHATPGHTGGRSLVFILNQSLCRDCPVSQKSLSFWRDLCIESKKYLDPFSVSLKNSIIQTGLIRSALIAMTV